MNLDIAIPVVLITLFYAPLIYEFIVLVKNNKFEDRFRIKKLKKKFKIFTILVLLAAGATALLSHTNYLNYQSPMNYSQVNDITFTNFRGIELFKKSLYGNKRFAYIHTTIDSDIEKEYVLLESHFHPSRSFVYKKNLSNLDLLTHEIFHFKITELYVRKAKKAIAGLSKPSRKEIAQIIKNHCNMERSYQIEYDYNTFHSYVLSEQKRYEKSVDSLLYLLSEFKDPKVLLKYEN